MNRLLILLLLIQYNNNSFAQNFHWAKSISGTDASEIFAMKVDGSGNAYSAGYFHGTADFDPGSGNFNLTSSGGHDVFVSKHDSLGNLVWAKKFGGKDNDVALAIALDDSGNVYCGGYFNGTGDFDPGSGIYNLTSAGSEDIFISKLDNLGNFVWAKSIGGPDNDVCLSLDVDRFGNVYGTGYFDGTLDFDPGIKSFNLTSVRRDIFITKFDFSGNFIWAKQMGGRSSEIGYSIFVDDSNNVYTTGSFLDTADFDPGSGNFNLISTGGHDIFISKLDSIGDFVWAKKMGGTNTDVSYSMVVDGLGNIYTSGSFTEKADFNPGNDTFNLISSNDNDIFISKLDAGGNFIWAKNIGATSYLFNDRSSSITCDIKGDVYLTGYFVGTIDFDPNSGTSNLTSKGFSDIFILKLNANGNFVLAKSMGGTGVAKGYSIAVTLSGSIFIAGSYTESADFDPSSGDFILNSAGERDAYISKLGKKSLELKKIVNQTNYSVFPNPATRQINVGFETNPGDVTYMIYDQIGRTVITGKLNSTITSIEISNLIPGIYLFSVGDNLTQTFTVIKQ